jgi:hypothetical protein
LDALSLANRLYELKSIEPLDITELFQSYFNERAPVAKAAIDLARVKGNFFSSRVSLINIYLVNFSLIFFNKNILTLN